MILQTNQHLNVVVRGIVIEDEELVLTEWEDKSWSFLLGGRIDFGEHILDALHREMQEEAGVSIQVQKLAYFSENIFRHPDGREFHEYGYYFLVRPERPICRQGVPIPNPDDPRLIIRRTPLTAAGLYNTWPRFLAHYLATDVANQFADCPRFLFSQYNGLEDEHTVETSELAALFQGGHNRIVPTHPHHAED